ncbi:MAG: MerR family DNA-binding protein [Candidatus Limnocylindria bacterium]
MSEVRAVSVRYDADRKLIRAASRSAGGQRLFDDGALTQLRFVRRMQRLGLALGEFARLVRATEELSCRPSSRVIVSRLRTHLTAVETRLQELDSVRHELSACSPPMRLAAATSCASAPRLVRPVRAGRSFDPPPSRRG